MSRFAIVLLIMLLGALPALAAAATPRDVQQGVGIDPHVGTVLPLSTRLRDEQGREVSLGEIFGGRPAVLALVYFDCPNLCNVTLASLRTALGQMDLKAGRDFNVIALSFDAREGMKQAAAKRVSLLGASRAGSAPGWHFLTGESTQIAAIAKAAGFRFFWDAEQSQFAHAAGITIITPQGRIARYFGGVEFPPPELRWALVEAARDKTTTSTDRLWLLCYHYGALIGQYSERIMTSLRFVAIAVMLGLAFLLWRLARNHP